MNYWKTATVVLGLFGIGGCAYGVDQHQKRVEEEKQYAKDIREKDERLTNCEATIESLIMMSLE